VPKAWIAAGTSESLSCVSTFQQGSRIPSFIAAFSPNAARRGAARRQQSKNLAADSISSLLDLDKRE
jgi:hypothetical protein